MTWWLTRRHTTVRRGISPGYSRFHWDGEILYSLLTSINDQGKRRAETAKKPVEFDLSFADPETASFRPRGQKSRVHSLGMNPYSHSPECRPVPCCLETRGVNSEIAGEREQKGKEKASVPTWERRLDNRFYSPMSLVALL